MYNTAVWSLAPILILSSIIKTRKVSWVSRALAESCLGSHFFYFGLQSAVLTIGVEGRNCWGAMFESITTAAMSPRNFLNHLLIHFLVFPSYKYSTILEFLHSTINMCILTIWYLDGYSVYWDSVFVFGSQVCILFFTFSIYLVFVSGSQFQLHKHLEWYTAQYIFSYRNASLGSLFAREISNRMISSLYIAKACMTSRIQQ